MEKITLVMFIFFAIYSINADPCEGTNNLKDCIDKTTGNKYKDYCCFFEELNEHVENKDELDKFCKTVPYSSFYTGYNREYLNGKLYNVTCKTKDEKTFALEQCGNIYKTGDASLKNCKEYSTFVDSCCFFSGKFDENINQGKQKLEKGCYWLGSKYEGTIQWAGAELECHHNFLNYPNIIL